jgi:ATP-dependent DNA helicase RecG
MKQKVFLSSVQNEFALEREALHRHLLSDPVLHLFFEPILFEKLPANGEQAQSVYLKEVAQADVYLILIGAAYGFETPEGISPTELEYDLAQKESVFSLAFIKNDTEAGRHPKEAVLFEKIQNSLSYKRFSTTEELLREVSRSLVNVLQQKGLLQLELFDSSIAKRASLSDIDEAKVNHFIGIARHKRGFPLREGSALPKVLSHLNLLFQEQLTNSAILAFGKNPQQFFPSAVVKCAYFHGTFVAKPIPDHRVIKGDVFMQVDEAVDFILSKIAVTVGMRLESNQAPLAYEIPRPVIAEAIVNAVAHRDYQSTGSVQVMLFADRVAISNPGGLPMELTLDKLRKEHASYPKNPHLAETLYQAGYIERFGTGTGEMIRLCKEAGLKEPVFHLEEGFSVSIFRPSTVQVTEQVTVQVTDQVADQVFVNLSVTERLVWVLEGEMKRDAIQLALALKHRGSFMDLYLNPALEEGLIAMTIPDKPTSSKQTYRLTKKGLKKKKELNERKNK